MYFAALYCCIWWLNTHAIILQLLHPEKIDKNWRVHYGSNWIWYFCRDFDHIDVITSKMHNCMYCMWRGVQCGCNVLAEIWRLVGTIAFRICRTCYRRTSTFWPGKLILCKKTPKNSLFWRHGIGVARLWEENVCQTIGPRSTLGYNGSN